MMGLAGIIQINLRGVRGWAALALIAASPIASLGVAAVNVLEMADMNALADSQETTVSRLERRARDNRLLPAPTVNEAQMIYLAGATPTLARADLQRLLVQTAEQSGGRVIEAQDDGAEDTPDLTAPNRVRLRLTFDARNEALADFLVAVETGLPLLRVERIEIRRLDGGADADLENSVLRIGVIVAGEGRFVSG